MIDWCRLRNNYRDFRLDRIEDLQAQNERFHRRSHDSLDEILNEMHKNEKLYSVILRFEKETANYIGESRYYQGFISQSEQGNLVVMEFLTPSLYSIGRWLLTLATKAEIINPVELRSLVEEFSEEIAQACLSRPKDQAQPAGKELTTQ